MLVLVERRCSINVPGLIHLSIFPDPLFVEACTVAMQINNFTSTRIKNPCSRRRRSRRIKDTANVHGDQIITRADPRANLETIPFPFGYIRSTTTEGRMGIPHPYRPYPYMSFGKFISGGFIENLPIFRHMLPHSLALESILGFLDLKLEYLREIARFEARLDTASWYISDASVVYVQVGWCLYV